MLSLLIMIVLIWNFYIGYSRGIILQSYYTLASLLSLVIASQFYKALADKITLWVPYSNAVEGAKISFFTNVNIFELDKVYYAGVAFTFLYIGAYLVFRFLGLFLHFAPIDNFDGQRLNLISGSLSVLVTLTFFSLIFTALATVPISPVQRLLTGSSLATFLINHLPILHSILKNLWVTNILK